ncbi:MAG: oligosaccharide flippase family protein, partial [Coriobacteriales bacterium]|nr:oligosaccharide flippase family protein [Coriobacteriales bacterium]
MASNLKSFLQGSVVLTFANGAIALISFFLLPLYTAKLTTAQYGINDTIVTLVIVLTPICTLGLDSAFTAFYYDKKTKEHRLKVFNTMFFSLVTFSIVLLIVMFFSRPLSLLLFQTQDYWGLICVACGTIIMALVANPFKCELRINSRMTHFSIITVSTSFINLSLAVIFVLFANLGEWSFIIASCTANTYAVLAYAISMKMPISPKLVDYKLLKGMLKFGLPLVPMHIFEWVIPASNTFFLLKFFGTSAVGIYGIANRRSQALGTITYAIQQSYTAYAFQTVQEKAAKTKFVKIVNALFLFICCICVVGSIFSKEIIYIFVEESFQSAYQIIPFLVFAYLTAFMNALFMYSLQFVKKSGYILLSGAFGCVISLGLNFILTPIYGFYGCAIALLTANVITCTFNYIFGQKFYKCPYSIIRIAIAFFVSLAICYLSAELFWGLKIPICLACIAFLFILFKDSIGQLLSIIKDALSKVKGKKAKANRV